MVIVRSLHVTHREPQDDVDKICRNHKLCYLNITFGGNLTENSNPTGPYNALNDLPCGAFAPYLYSIDGDEVSARAIYSVFTTSIAVYTLKCSCSCSCAFAYCSCCYDLL